MVYLNNIRFLFESCSMAKFQVFQHLLAILHFVFILILHYKNKSTTIVVDKNFQVLLFSLDKKDFRTQIV